MLLCQLYFIIPPSFFHSSFSPEKKNRFFTVERVGSMQKYVPQAYLHLQFQMFPRDIQAKGKKSFSTLASLKIKKKQEWNPEH
jgi:hypothetical protein